MSFWGNSVRLIKGALAFFGYDLEKLDTAVKTIRDEKQKASRKTADHIRIAKLQRLKDEALVPKLVSKYYFEEPNASTHGQPFAFSVDGTRIDIPLACPTGSSSLSIPLNGTTEHCRLADIQIPDDLRPDKSFYADLLLAAKQGNTRIWNDPLYRLIEFQHEDTSLRLMFALTDFFTYRLTNGRLIDEAADALITANFDIDAVLSQRESLLSLRTKLAKDVHSLFDFGNRMCAGGICCMLAIARPDPYNDYAIPILRRSSSVALKQGLLSVVPQAFHQPVRRIHSAPELSPSLTIYRELAEELYGVNELENGSVRLAPDWFLSEFEQMAWFTQHRSAYSIECIGMGVDLLLGDYHIGALLAIHDESYWQKYYHLFRTHWEFAKDDGSFVSSSDKNVIKDLIHNSQWSAEGLFVFANGLKRLHALRPSHVRIPSIELAS